MIIRYFRMHMPMFEAGDKGKTYLINGFLIGNKKSQG